MWGLFEHALRHSVKPHHRSAERWKLMNPTLERAAWKGNGPQGVRPNHRFSLHLKECEFLFNHRGKIFSQWLLKTFEHIRWTSHAPKVHRVDLTKILCQILGSIFQSSQQKSILVRLLLHKSLNTYNASIVRESCWTIRRKKFHPTQFIHLQCRPRENNHIADPWFVRANGLDQEGKMRFTWTR